MDENEEIVKDVDVGLLLGAMRVLDVSLLVLYFNLIIFKIYKNITCHFLKSLAIVASILMLVGIITFT